MMNQRQEQLTKLISNINQIEDFFSKQSKRLSQDKIEEILKAIRELKEKIHFYSLVDIDVILKFTDELLHDYLIIFDKDDYDFLNENLSDILINLNKFNNHYFEDTLLDDVEPDKLISLVSIVKSKFDRERKDFPPKLIDYLKEILLSNEKLDSYYLDDFYNSFIKIYNNMMSHVEKLNRQATEDLRDAYTNIRQLHLDNQENEIVNSTESLNYNTKRIKENLGLAENEKLISVFKIQAEEYGVRIENYTHIIIFVFSSIALSILLKLILLRDEVLISHAVVFISFILSLSGLLTYLIKERTRLVNLQTYCIKCYLELSALPNYLADLTEEQSQSLKIELSKIYFKGYTIENKKEESKFEVKTATDLIEKITKLITDIKK
ncbi:hypothetical protein [Acinetobacter bereziniae]|uniref:hypothetical protein n=1 Tax=Acinetobacter bereziniae TaxID=106648 RepID=UPI00073FA182|nr:hypothetical protein [Acinetobacter bereziniae]RSZ25740.1 hypothetical protein NDM229_006785 [Acinetobacter bereziniae]